MSRVWGNGAETEEVAGKNPLFAEMMKKNGGKEGKSVQTKITMINGEAFMVKGHPDQFIESFTGDYEVITKDLVMVPIVTEDRNVVISTRNILKIELIND